MKRLLICLLVLTLVGVSALAETDTRIGAKLQVVNCNEYITLREEPDTGATALSRIPLKGGVISLGGWENGFVRVAWKGQTGWALEEYLQTAGEKGAPVELTSRQRYNLNLFISNFTEVEFCRLEGGYSDEWADPVQLTDFALIHSWFDSESQLEWGYYFDGNNVRLSEGQIAPVIEKYFGLKMKASHTPHYVDYRDGYYYWLETGGSANGGFACLDEVEKLSGNRYRVWFDIYYDKGKNWDNDVCYYTPAQAAKAYPKSVRPYGCAVINTGGSGLNDRSDWAMNWYAVNYDVWD